MTKMRQFAGWLAEVEIWMMALLVVLSMVFQRVLPIVALAAGLYLVIRWLAYGRLTLRTPPDVAVILLLLTLPITLWATALPEKTVPQVYRLLTGIALYYAIVNWGRSQRQIQMLAFGIVAAGLVLGLGAAVSVEWSTTKLPFIPPVLYEQFQLLVADTVNPNVMGGALALFLPVVTAMLLFAWKRLAWGMRTLHVAAFVVMLGFLALTQSRSALLAFGISLVVLVVLRWRWGWLAMAMLGVATVLGFRHYQTLIPLDSLLFGRALGGLDGRIEIWARAVYMVQDFSFTGVGMGLFGDVADLIYPFFLYEPGRVSHAHNLFLQIAVDLGLPGLIAWLTILWLVIVAAWQVYRRGRKKGNSWVAGLGAGLLASQLALVLHGLTDAVTWGQVRSAPIVWALWGIAIASQHLYVEHVRSVPHENQPE